MTSFWTWLVSQFAKSFFDFIKELIQTERANQAQRELGAAQQKQKDLEATAKAKEVANESALAPSDVEATIKELEDGTF